MATTRFIPLQQVSSWLDELAATQTVYTPQRENAAVVYRQHVAGSMPEFATRPTESAKHVIFPRAHELFTFTYKADPEVIGKKNISLQEPPAVQPTVIFGAPSCDVRGFFAFDPVYNGCGTKGLAKDVYYLQRREATTIIALACRTALGTCFCNWTGGSPSSQEGADVHATLLQDGLVLEACTDKGEKLLAIGTSAEASAEQKTAAQEQHQAAAATLQPMPEAGIDPQRIAAALLSHFDNMDFWQQESAGCLGCGACTYLCPTCYCFTITDESNGISGVRLRSWDTCMTSLFTLEASGHNPRQNKAARLKNRVGHKFSYYPTLHGGRFSCCGCGRCIKSCPSSVDIRKIVLDALTTESAKESANG